jgi:hypothetical protein
MRVYSRDMRTRVTFDDGRDIDLADTLDEVERLRASRPWACPAHDAEIARLRAARQTQEIEIDRLRTEFNELREHHDLFHGVAGDYFRNSPEAQQHETVTDVNLTRRLLNETERIQAELAQLLILIIDEDAAYVEGGPRLLDEIAWKIARRNADWLPRRVMQYVDVKWHGPVKRPNTGPVDATPAS